MSFSPRVMVVHLRNADGPEISVVGAHFHHEPSKRLAQYELLRKQSNYINLGRHCVLLADHNSVIAPGVDSEVCTVHDGLPDAVRARDAELAFCVSHDLCDAWSNAFKPTKDPDADHTPKGWTWGFHTEHRADPESGSEVAAPLPFAPHRRRIDRIHFASHMLHSLTRCYTHRLGGSDHRAVIATLSPPHSTDTQQRLRVPVSFLKDPETVKEMEAELKAVRHQGDGWWEEATKIIKKTAFRFEKSIHTQGTQEALAMLMSATLRHTPAEALRFLREKGLHPQDTQRAYAMLQAFAEKEKVDRNGTTILRKLQQVLQEEPATVYQKQQRKMEVARLTRELQQRRRLAVLRDKGGLLLTEPTAIAKALQEQRSGIMAAGTKTVPECIDYLNSLPLAQNIKNVAPILLRPLTQELVLTALENLKRGSSPWVDGIPAEIFQAPSDVFVPRMFRSISDFLQRGSIPHDWSLGILSPIPKEQRSVSINCLRPICLQNVLLKWLSASLYLMLQDVVAFVTPSEQKAFIQGRFIFDHIWNARGAWQAMQEGVMIPIDFSKAYDSIQHNYMVAFFLHIALPIPLIALLMALFKAPFLFGVARGVVKDVLVHPHSGVKQGDPLSPAIFVMVSSVLVRKLQSLSPCIHILFYADDLLIYIPLPPPTVSKLLTHIFEAIRVYGLFVGLRINLGKSAFLLKGEWGEDHKRILASFGVPVKAKIRYLGIVLGHVSSEEAYTPTIARAMQRAEFMRTLPLTHHERVALFQEWVLPLLIFPARAYFPTHAVISQVSVVYKTALCLTSWGLTLPILELRPGLGGDTLPRPSKFSLWQHATAFMLSRQESTVVPPLSRSHLRTWASTFGVPLEARFLPWLQLGPIPWKTYPFLGMSCKAFSLLRKPAKVPPPPPTHLLKNNGWKCLWRGHPAQPTDQLKPPTQR